MAARDEQVEQIVHEVLSRLGGRAGASPAPAQVAAASTTNAELTISEHVVSANALADRLNGIQRVVVGPRAVVTPAARDLLKEKNITLVRALKSPTAASVRLIVATAASKTEAENLVQALRQQGVEVELLSAAGLPQGIEALCDPVSKGEKLGLFLTDQIAAALCLANRRRGIRAATAANRGEVNSAVAEIGANLLVVDPLRRSKLEIQRIVESFVSGPARQCPAELKAWLE